MDILNFTQAMSDQKRIRVGNFETTEMPYWRQAVMSPVFYKGGLLPPEKELNKLIRGWKKAKYNSRTILKYPYFNILLKKNQKLPQKAIAHFEKLGWKMADRTLYFNCFKNLVDCNFPEKIKVEVADKKNRLVLRQYMEANQKAFKFSDEWMKLIEQSIKIIPKGQIILLKNLRGKVVAAGTICYSGRYAYCFGGFVDKNYRGKGLWRVMMSVRQGVSLSFGVREWCYVTSNELIREKGSTVLKSHYFYRSES